MQEQTLQFITLCWYLLCLRLLTRCPSKPAQAEVATYQAVDSGTKPTSVVL